MAKHQSIPKSIDTNPIVSEWRDDNTDGDESDGDHDDNEMLRRSKKYPIPPLRLRGENQKPLVETVTEEETEEVIADQRQPQMSTNRALIPTTTTTILPPQKPQKPEYDPMADKPPPAIITPSYVPLHKKNKHWDDQC